MEFTLAPGEIMVSYDFNVTALFTNTPIPDTLRIIRERLNSDATLSDRTTLSVDMELREHYLFHVPGRDPSPR